MSDSREFFSARTSDIVRIISTIPGAIFADSNGVAEGAIADPPLEEGVAEAPMPWEQLMRRAQEYLLGAGLHFQDIAKAKELFEQAALMGSVVAYARLGEIAERESKNSKQAIEYYMQGIPKGNIYCCWRAAMLYWNAGNEDLAGKLFEMFMKFQEEGAAEAPGFRDTIDWSAVDVDCFELLTAHLNHENTFPEMVYPLVAKRAVDILKLAESRAEAARLFLGRPGEVDEEMMSFMGSAVVAYLQDYLRETGKLRL